MTVDTIIELAEMVKLLRDTQKAYFKTRDPKVLAESKLLERGIDAVVARILSKQGVLGGVA